MLEQLRDRLCRCVLCHVLQVVMWLNQNFLLVDEYHTESSLDIAFLCLRALPNKHLLAIKMDHNGEVRFFIH